MSDMSFCFVCEDSEGWLTTISSFLPVFFCSHGLLWQVRFKHLVLKVTWKCVSHPDSQLYGV